MREQTQARFGLALMVGLTTALPVVAPAQISVAEYTARRNALAAKLDSGIVVAFGGRTLVTDFNRFFQLPAFHYLTGYDEPDAAFVIVARGGHATTTLFVTRLEARTAFYYGQRADTATLARTLAVQARSAAALPAVVDSLVATGLPVYTLTDFEDADFARADSLTRGQEFIKGLEARHPLFDLDLVQLCLRLPPLATFDRHRSRPVLRTAMAGLLPDSVRLRPEKALFDSLLLDCLAGRDGETARRLLCDPSAEVRAYANQDALRRALFGPGVERSFQWMWQVWRLLSAECWLRAQSGRGATLGDLGASPTRVELRSV